MELAERKFRKHEREIMHMTHLHFRHGIRLFAGRFLLPVLLLLALPLAAHVGSPDVYFDGHAGPYQLMVTIRPPAMIPGVAEIEVRSSDPGLTSIKGVPMYIVGEGSKYPPAPDPLQRSKDDPQFFTGRLWIMGSGSWQVRLEAEGTQGSGTLAVPVPAAARRTLPMLRSLGVFLFAVMIFLVAALVTMLGAGSREAFLAPGEQPLPANRWRAWLVMGLAAVALAAILFGGNVWWNSEADGRARGMIYKPPALTPSLDGHGNLLLKMATSRWHSNRSVIVGTRLIPDHGHLMHLFLIRSPQADCFYHLHPEMSDKSDPPTFTQTLPSLPAGHYQIFADIVRASGFPDTMTAEIDLPETTGAPLTGDDSEIVTAAITPSVTSGNTAEFSDGSHMIWTHDATPLRAGKAILFRFRVDDKNGKPATDLEPYMGMAGHAVFLDHDRSVFAHVHPEGSVAMAAMALLEPQGQVEQGRPMMAMHHAMESSPEVSFPWGFPKAGDYRIFVQVRKSGRVETGVFDTHVVE